MIGIGFLKKDLNWIHSKKQMLELLQNKKIHCRQTALRGSIDLSSAILCAL